MEELGFSGLQEQFRAFRGDVGGNSVGLKEFLQLRECVTRQDKRLTELERQLSKLLNLRRKTESEMRESVEKKVEEAARVCANEVSQKVELALSECAK